MLNSVSTIELVQDVFVIKWSCESSSIPCLLEFIPRNQKQQEALKKLLNNFVQLDFLLGLGNYLPSHKGL